MKRLGLADFWARVAVKSVDDCWEYEGPGTPAGYGQFCGKYAHRMSYELHRGPIPDGLHIRHKCDNPRCCNPAHLETGTSADNHRDMVERGRSTAGEKHRLAKISRDQRDEIRRRVQCGEMQKNLTSEYGLSKAQISRIVNGRRWASGVV